jgi:hypothetical protein
MPAMMLISEMTVVFLLATSTPPAHAPAASSTSASTAQRTLAQGWRGSPPPPPPVERVEPRRGWIWVEGNYEWRHGRYIWQRGHWERERPGHHWRRGRWEQQGDRYVWVRGDWGGPEYEQQPPQPVAVPPPPAPPPPPPPAPEYGYERRPRHGGVAIVGRVTAPNGAPIPGVMMVLAGTSEGRVVTDGGGNYFFGGLRFGSYAVRPEGGGCRFAPDVVNLNNIGGGETVQNFVCHRR